MANVWSGWINLGGELRGGPTVTAGGPHVLNVFVIQGVNRELLYRHWDGATWSGWINLGGDSGSSPAVAVTSEELYIFVRGENGELVYRHGDGNEWSGWINLGGELRGGPTVTAGGPHVLNVFVQGVNRELLWDGATWSGWINLGGDLGSSPAVTATASGELYVFVRGENGELVYRDGNGAEWSGWINLGGELIGAPCAIARGTQRLDVFARGSRLQLLHIWRDGGNWSQWRDFGGRLESTPTVAAIVRDRLDLFARGPNRHLMHRFFPFRPTGAVRTRLRLLSHNIYGKKGRQCDLRGSRLGTVIANADPPYDIVGLQEFYDGGLLSPNCCPDHFQDAIWRTGRYRNSNNYNRFNPVGEFWQGNRDGGIAIFTLHPIEEFDEWEWDNKRRFFWSGSLHGFIFARIRIPFTSVSVDTYVVHLYAESDGCDRSCRREELEQLANQVASLSQRSGNPVLIMGDFNIGGPPTYNGNTGYADLMDILRNPRDLWLEQHDADGFTYDCEENTLLDCEPGDLSQRIDYVFVMTDPLFTNTKYQIIIPEPNDVRLLKERVVEPPYGHHVSDHFGIEATIEIRE
jgi:endonuclease/exonuclease/phosphatase family metal-dependent hydrolase